MAPADAVDPMVVMADVALRHALDQQRSETVQMVKTLGDAMEKITSNEKTDVVDVKAVGKPEMLQGETKEQIKQKWPLWAFGFTTWFVSQYQKTDEMLRMGSSVLQWGHR